MNDLNDELDGGEPRSHYTVKSVDRAIDLLEALSTAREPVTVTELARLAGGSKSAVFATLQTLLGRGLVRSTGGGADRRYHLGLELARLGEIALARLTFRAAAGDSLMRLTAASGLPSCAVAWTNGSAVVAAFEDSATALNPRLSVGEALALHASAAGKALLSTMADDRVTDLLRESPPVRLTPHTLTDPDALLDELQRIRETGYAVSAEEATEGLVSVAAPVTGHRSELLGALTLSLLAAHTTERRTRDLGILLRQEANSLSVTLGALL